MFSRFTSCRLYSPTLLHRIVHSIRTGLFTRDCLCRMAHIGLYTLHIRSVTTKCAFVLLGGFLEGKFGTNLSVCLPYTASESD